MSCQVENSANKKIEITIKRGKQESGLSLGWRRWEDLSLDILDKIFDGVNSSDLHRNVSAVCRSWQLSCWLFFCRVNNELDLSVVDASLEIVRSTTVKRLNKIGVPFSNKKYVQALVDIKLLNLLRSIMEDDVSGNYLAHQPLSIRKVLVPRNIEISDKHLIYIAERTTGVEELKLLGSSRITGAGFAKAISNWKNVKHVHLGEVRAEHYPQIMEEIDKCSMLDTLFHRHRLYFYGLKI